jgi:hypothetical protein
MTFLVRLIVETVVKTRRRIEGSTDTAVRNTRTIANELTLGDALRALVRNLGRRS